MDFVFALIFGIACSIVTGVFCMWIRTDGTLKIDHTNPEKDVYRFEINDLDKLKGKTYITLKIDHNAKLSQD